jgi:hypothetical protein
MSWIILVLGSIIGSVFSAMSRQNRESVLLRVLSFAIPFASGATFWYLQYKSGEILAAVSGDLASNLTTAAVSMIICMLISKLLGILIAKYIEVKS